MINKRTRGFLLMQLVVLCFLALSLSLVHAADVTLTVGDASGSPGSSENPVAVSLENQDDRVRGLQVDVCDVDDYLTCTMICETTDRTADFACVAEEITNPPDNPSYGCCRAILYGLENPPPLIGVGQGSIFTIKYTISSSAPGGACIDLNPEGVQVADENGDPFPSDDVVSEPGEFCFVSTTTTAASTTTTVKENPCLIRKIYSENSEEVAFLRNFRDEVLSKTPSGRELIRLYYQWWGPAIVKAIEEDKVFRKEVKEIIDTTLPLISLFLL